MGVEEYKNIIEECIKYVGLDPEDCWDPEGEYWTFYKGSAVINIYIFPLQKESGIEYYVSFESPILRIPDNNREVLYERLLKENAQRIAVKFGIRDDWVICETNRELDGIDFEEALRCMFRVAEVADALDDEIKELFPNG